jgi:hypothetical protein
MTMSRFEEMVVEKILGFEVEGAERYKAPIN